MFFFFKQKTAYEMRISDWSSDVCSSDLYEVLSHIQFHYGRCWPLDLALWDLTGKITGEPVWRLLGGRSDRVRAYASSGVLRDPGAMAETAERFAEAGFGALKLRFHRGDRKSVG